MVTRALSLEDGSLNTPSIITSRKVNYSDIDIAFLARPSGDIYKKVDAAAVKQSVKNILLTNPGEKPFKPLFGGGLSNLLFELIDIDAEEQLDEAVKNAISNFEPRAKVIDTDFSVSNDNNAISLRIVFQILTTNETVTLETSLARVR